MGQFIKWNKVAGGIWLLVLILGGNCLQAQCSNWHIETVIDSATCAADGRITISIQGVDAANLDSFHYSLTPQFTGGNSIYQSTTPVMQNLKPGAYRITVDALCSQQPVSQILDVTVPGSYRELTAAVFLKRNALHSCNTGQIQVNMNQGRLPYRIVLTAYPASYAGPKSFVTNQAYLVVDSLSVGSYTVSVTDACSTTPAIGGVQVSQLPALTGGYISPFLTSMNNCNSFITYLYMNLSGLPGYSQDDLQLVYSASLDSGPKTPYRPLNGSNDTFLLAAGKTMKDYYGKQIAFYVKGPCQDEIRNIRSISNPGFRYTVNRDCNNHFSFNTLYYYQDFFCNPLVITLENRETGYVLTDTVSYNVGSYQNSRQFPLGKYKLKVVSGDSAVLYQDTQFDVLELDTISPYSVVPSPSNYSLYGQSGAGQFVVSSRYSPFPVGTTIRIIYPFTTTGVTVSSGNNYTYYLQNKDDGSVLSPGYYVVRVSDPCKRKDYDFPVYISDDNVFYYHWSYTMERTCLGMKITPSGTVRFGASTEGGKYIIMSATAPYPVGVISEGESFVLPFAGTYTIGMSDLEWVFDFGDNVKTITFEDSPLKTRADSTLGWVCPGDPNNAGHIKIRAAFGNSTTSHYLYKLAADGNGETGPYLDSNYTGNFDGSSNYQLMRNASYQVKIIDDCNASIVQRVTILDFANFQVITTDKPLFCINDEVYLRAFNLPTTAKYYSWTGPNSFTSTDQIVTLHQVKPKDEGVYHVSISSDMCSRPIEGSVNIRLAPYVTYCYSAVTDTSVNPYTFGMLGNWRPSRSYVYYGARAQSSTAQATNVRSDGAFDAFSSFWKQQTKGWAKDASYDTTAWVWNAESTIFNKKGFELENKDPLGRYNAALYGYDNAIPVATVQNSRYREAAFDGFEDYSFVSGKCDDGACPVDRRLDFSNYIPKMDTTQHHTGRYSLRLEANDTVQVKVPVIATETTINSPRFILGSSACTPYQVLSNVKVDSTILLPPFSPVAGNSMLFSVWVKEEQDCKCTAYTHSKITLFVAGDTRLTADVTPVGSIIDGWQRYERVVDLPVGSTGLSVVMATTGGTRVYLDDLRFHPYHANMKSFVYDPQNLRLMAELDENNYATFYEYDDDGTLTRVKKETERGVKTIKETRNGFIKEDNE
ncbi:hypothetical protein HGH93_15595 [Chitinophaga polysaccharea]|uniref:hypothetical protein n=1 Tax=Chitinophaga TaxID=79328 RepID=UPI001454F236|nr:MULTISPECIES: hypothetical protein [Chitinophaga]NLR59537.1 hypothetical protein [Chitinophaga polysaccharea]NLU96172.1 hypothetical protein [Chitinophaga sp. Ak27]